MTRFTGIAMATCVWLFASATATAAERVPSLAPAPRTVRPQAAYERSLDRATATLGRSRRRGLVLLDPALPTVVIPDVHARTEFLSSVLAQKDEVSGQAFGTLLRDRKIQVVLVGDGMHAEGRAEMRWTEAEKNPNGRAMREEIGESLGTMKQIMDFKTAYPDNFHYLKGNHDNIRNHRRGGDHPVAKYSEVGEGNLVKRYLTAHFGRDFVTRYAAFERQLPIMAVGGNFVVSHSGPKRALPREAIAARAGKAVENFTWTDLTRNSQREAKVVAKQLALLDKDGGFYVAGHRPTGARLERRQGAFHQVNSDTELRYLVLRPGENLRPARDIRTISDDTPVQ